MCLELILRKHIFFNVFYEVLLVVNKAPLQCPCGIGNHVLGCLFLAERLVDLSLFYYVSVAWVLLTVVSFLL